MAEGDQDDAQKTEEPTARKLEEAVKKGDFPQSQELKHWMMLVAGAFAFLFTSDLAVRTIRSETAGFLAHAHEIPMDGYAVLGMMRDVGGNILLVLLLPLAVLMIGAFAGNLVQNKLVFTAEKIKPKLDKISPLAGAKRMFSAQRVADFLKTLAKLLIVSIVVGLILWPEAETLVTLVREPLITTTAVIVSLSVKAMFGVIGAMTLVAGIDYIFQQTQHTKKMRMTKQEVKDEHKQMEGDPMVKQRLRQVRMEKSRKRMMAAVPQASVIITNPTHFAIALKYSHGDMDVPVVIAKGVDAVAFRIRAVAEEHAIPLVENPPLARALYASTEVDDEIPADHYQAVAQIISYVLRLRRDGRASYRPS
ncbi:flagellar biosynthesis protein FlhB [Iodidimonas nitroreducens]|uniref:Flagellar biosynthetic protein FlhB n=1 Tax=Iodidimonas nitroreducens TaxID=1236968 RepID=A0A5A7N916_9PROT|nr:flagellar biosynthesis protein FlhB [Iodidimonas nitroreducens]GAK34326.1 flagellar biosynthetic protein FlhB [alpha proteobacterium Q-1]GER03559.1 flagellar biosynthesis protein FlhB [Iodidimonas nitroreducens]